MVDIEKHWSYCVLRGRWQCWETGAWGFPSEGDWFLDYDEWRVW